MGNIMFQNIPLIIAKKKLPRNKSNKDMHDISRESYKALLKVKTTIPPQTDRNSEAYSPYVINRRPLVHRR